MTADEVDVIGATNLPPQAAFYLHVYDYIGTGSHVISEGTVPAGRDGLFETKLRPKSGFEFKRNMLCDVVFAPSDPMQPAAVVKAVGGRRGTLLGNFVSNPEVETNSGGQLLALTTVLSD
jgi:hypothetical protein